ncbi:MAG TPA: zinc ribbon domain-containing protein [Verrucomicrobiae bacterium]|nr:zinc ribbon domain-containing protein [Verrucomicrobiae bacterium]
MFCSRCGAQLQPNSVACSNCGRRLGDPVGPVAQSRLQGHLQTLGILWIILGALFLIPAVPILLFGGGLHIVVHQQEPLATLLPIAVYFIGATLLILGAGGVCVGLGLKDHQPWARIAAIILGVLALFHPPLGTALGIYTLWVLLADENGEEYRYLGTSA